MARERNPSETDDAKQEVRERVWALLQRENAARFSGARGRIPHFAGADEAAAGLAELSPWRSARVVKANPDRPQLPVRAGTLADGKLLYMAVPRLTEQRPFVELDPARLEVEPRRAAAKDRALECGRPLAVSSMQRIDLVVCGTVAVNRQGVRVGKGGGFSDLEFGLLVEAGLVDDRTVIATTVHPLQLLDEELPETAHDFRVDVIVTPDEVVRVRGRKRSPGILWDHLAEDKIARIPALAARRRG